LIINTKYSETISKKIGFPINFGTCYDFLYGFYIHGSYATGENINYSDLDLLMIINDEFRNKKSYIKFRQAIEDFSYKFDPFQHHSPFVIYKSELYNYPQTYFPYELFEYTVSVLKDRGLSLEIKLPDYIDYHAPFKNLKSTLF